MSQSSPTDTATAAPAAPDPNDRNATELRRQLDEVRHAVETLQAKLNRLEGSVLHLQDPCGRVFIAQRDGDTGFQERIPKDDGSAMNDFVDGRAVDDGDPMGLIDLAADETAVLAFHIGNKSFHVPIGQSFIPVALTQTSGSLGNKTTSSSWVYTVKSIDGVTTLATGKTPLVARPHGTLAAASYGLAYRLGGTLYLLYAFEIQGDGSCG